MSDEGQIGEIDLIQRLVDLGRERFTGAIRFEQDGIIKIVYFKGGDVLSASTNDRTDAVDEILLRAGKVSKDHVKQALAKRKESESLGDALLNLGFITKKELTWARRVQAIGILRSVRGWKKGSYAIVADYLPKREEGTHFPLPQVIVEMFVTDQDRAAIDRSMHGGTVVFEKADGFDEAFERIGLNEEAAQIASKIDGSRSASDIAGAAGKDAFNTYKLLAALHALGLLKPQQKAEVTDELAFGAVGVADASNAFDRSSPMPAFELEPEPPVSSTGEEAPPPPPAIASVPKPSEVQWGFDEAQIETANRAAAASSAPAAAPPKGARRTPPQFTRPQQKATSRTPVYVLIVVLLLAGASFGGWYWWTTMRQPATNVASTAPVRRTPAVRKQSTAPAPSPAPVPMATTSTPAPTPMPAPAPVIPKPAPVPVAQPQVQPKPQPQPPPVQPQPKPQAQAAGKFTIQIELVCQAASLKKASEAGGGNVWSAPITYRGQQCHRVFWGHFATRAEAEAGTAQIPQVLRGSKPVVVAAP